MSDAGASGAGYGPVELAIAAAASAVTVAQAAASTGEAEAELIYQLSEQVFVQGEVELAPALIAAEQAALVAGLEVYMTAQVSARDTFRREEAAMGAAQARLNSAFEAATRRAAERVARVPPAAEGVKPRSPGPASVSDLAVELKSARSQLVVEARRILDEAIIGPDTPLGPMPAAERDPLMDLIKERMNRAVKARVEALLARRPRSEGRAGGAEGGGSDVRG